MPGQNVGPERSGSCANVVMIIEDTIYVINVGDSRAFMSIDADADERDDYRNHWRREVLGEQLRLLYVALTRAANRCYLYWGNIKNEPSLFSYLAQPDLLGAQLIEQALEFGALREQLLSTLDEVRGLGLQHRGCLNETCRLRG